MATPQHTPWGRGYDTWLGYFQHANDYWTKGGNIAATGEIDNCLNSFLDFFETNAVYRGGVVRPNFLSDDCENSTDPDPPCYEEHIFKTRAKELIRLHDESVPMFMFYSFHLIHSPLQVPLSYQKRIKDMVLLSGGESFSSQNRMLYAAMVLYLDDVVGELTEEFKRKNMWDNTLIVFTSDNGGPIYEPGSGNNHPLKGGKYSDWEGGVRTNAFLSGGYIPERLRNTKHEHIISIADWYATLCVMAGGSVSFCTSDAKADKANAWIQQTNNGLPLLPAIDSVPQWASILSHSQARSGIFHLSENAVIDWPFKLVVGIQNYSAWTGELYPNCSTIWNLSQGMGPQFVDFKVFGVPQADSNPAVNKQTFWQEDCSSGCLYNIWEDSTEQVNLASENPVKVRFLKRRLVELNKQNFLPYRGDGSFKACERSLANGHYYGPFVHAEGFYTEPFVPVNSSENKQLLKQLLVVNGPGGLVQEAIIFLFGKASPVVGMISRYQTDVCLTCEEFADSEAFYGSSSNPDLIFAFLVGCVSMMALTAVCMYACSRCKKRNSSKQQPPSLSRETSASIESVDSGVEDA
jgi:arylsulfatase I/J